MSSALWPLTMVVLWLSYSLASTGNSRTDVKSGFSGPRIDRFLTDFQSHSMRRRGYKYTDGIGGHKYIPLATTWEEARKICKKDGSDLTIINSQREAKVISKLRAVYHRRHKSHSPKNVWVGTFIPSVGQGEWQTIFGDSITETGYNKWLIKPNNHLYGNCGTILRNGRLHWLPCTKKFGFVCEVPYVPPLAYKVHTSPKRWFDARKICREEGGDLAIINSNSEAEAIAKIFDKALSRQSQLESYNPLNIWIGMLRPAPGQGNWQTIYGDSSAEAGYDEWFVKPEDTAHGICGDIFRDGGLGWLSCRQELGFVCEGPYNNTHDADDPDSEIGFAIYKGTQRNSRDRLKNIT